MARDVLVRFRVSDDGTVALERVARAADRAEEQLDQAGREGQEAGRKIHDGASHGESGIGGLVGKLGAVAAAMGGIYAVKAGFEAIISTGAKFESLGRSFETAMGSAAAGEQAMAWVRTFTAETPYQLEQVAGGFLRLRNAGIDPTSGSLEALGDAVAAYAGGSTEAFGRVVTAVGQIGAKGKLTGEELMQLAEANIPVYQILQEELGLTGEQVGNIGAQGISAAVGLQALFEGLNERVGGAMAAQMTTLGGLWSNFQDQVTATLNELATNGAMDAVKDGLQSLMDALTRAAEDGTIAELGQSLGGMLQDLADQLPGILEYAIAFAQRLDEIATAAINLGKVLVVLWAVEKMEAFSLALSALPMKFAAATTASGKLTAAMGPLAIAIGAAVLAGNALAAWFDKMHSLAGYKQSLDDAAAKQAAFNEAMVITYGSLSRASQLFGMSTQELYDYYQQVEKTAGADSQWQGIIQLTNALLEENATVTVGAAQATSTLRTASESMAAKLDALNASAAGTIAQFQSWDRANEEFLGTSGELGDSTQDLTGYVEDLDEAVMQMAADWGASHELPAFEWFGPPQLPSEWELLANDVRGLLADAVYAGFEGGFEDVGDLLEGLTEGWSRQLAGNMANAFAEGGWSGVEARAAAHPGETLIGGASSIYQASQQGSRTAGTLQGMMGGASMGATIGSIYPVIGTVIGAVIGAVVGGLVGYFTSGSSDPATTGASIGVGGSDIFDTGGHQGYGEERRTRWEQSMNAVYLRQWQQYRGIAEMFGSADLMGLMGELPSWSTDVAGTGSRESMEVSADELARILSDTILPAEFAETFRAVFRTGLERLGISDAMFEELEGMLSDLPGQERMRYLQDYVGTVVGMSRLLVDLGTETIATRGGPQQASNLTARAGQDPWDTFWIGFDEALGQVDVLTAGWEDMNLAMQIEQGTQVLALGETWYQNMLQYQTALIDMQKQMQAGIDSFRDRLALRDMNDSEKGAWYQEQFQGALGAMRGGDTPTEIQDAYNRAMQMLQGLEGLGGGGYSMPSWMLQGLLSQLEEQMQASMGGLQSEVETQAQALGEAVGEVLADLLGVGGDTGGGLQSVDDALTDFVDGLDDLGGDDGDLGRLGDKALDTSDRLDGLGNAANRLAQALDAAAASAYGAAAGTGGYSSALASLAYQIALAQTRGASAATQSAAFA